MQAQLALEQNVLMSLLESIEFQIYVTNFTSIVITDKDTKNVNAIE